MHYPLRMVYVQTDATQDCRHKSGRNLIRNESLGGR